MSYDLLIKGGRVIDPGQGIDDTRDVAVQDGRIAAVDVNTAGDAATVIDAGGKLVTPGLIDFNTHVNWGTMECLDPDLLLRTGGVTTNVDAGTVGAQDYVQFNTFIVNSSQSRVLAFLNASCIGMLWTPEYFELDTLWVPDGFLLFMQRPQDLIPQENHVLKGLTMRVFAPETAGAKTREAVAKAKDVALLADVPLMLQLASLPDCLPELLGYLTPGDLISRVYGPQVGPALFGSGDENGDENKETRAALDAALARGVLMDVAHGARGFDFGIAQQALADGYAPHTISTGLYGDCIDRVVCDLPTTLSKFLHLGMGLGDVIRCATLHPARILGLEAEIGDLRPGSAADVTILELEQGSFALEDGSGNQVNANRRLRAVGALRAGRPVEMLHNAARAATTWLPT